MQRFRRGDGNPQLSFMVVLPFNPNRIPGALVMMNPYVAAAKFVLQKNATERDIKRTAEEIAEQFVRYEQQIQ